MVIKLGQLATELHTTTSVLLEFCPDLGRSAGDRTNISDSQARVLRQAWQGTCAEHGVYRCKHC